jgi:hypothetical protein
MGTFHKAKQSIDRQVSACLLFLGHVEMIYNPKSMGMRISTSFPRNWGKNLAFGYILLQLAQR